MPRANALIGLGSNLGDRLATLEAALEQLQNSADIEIFRQSPWLETEPVGGTPDQSPFLNGAAWLKTNLSPTTLLARMHEIELSLGRARSEFWGPRTLDLDLLLYDDLVLSVPELQIPHRWLPFRHFVLDPAVVIAPEWMHPILQKSIYDLRVQLNAIPYWFVIAGSNLTIRQSLAEELADQFQGFQIAPLERGGSLAGELSLRELPPRGIFISCVDWTKQESETKDGLKLVIPASDSNPGTSWRLAAGVKSWPYPKARIQLCANEHEFLTTEWNSTLLPLYQAFSPLPTLNLREATPEILLDQAITMIKAMTPQQ